MDKESFDTHCEKFLFERKNKGLLRSLNRKEQIKIDFSNNDYLGLSKHHLMCESAIAIIKKIGLGSQASRLILYDTNLFEETEHLAAKSFGLDSSIFFSSCWQLNVSAIPAIINSSFFRKKASVVCDRNNHSSMYRGCINSGAKIIRYSSLDMNSLERRLKQQAKIGFRCMVVSELTFGTTGEKVSIKDLLFLIDKYNAALYLDDTHGFGLSGRNGFGEASGMLNENCFLAVGFGKAGGSSGAFLNCSVLAAEYIANTCEGLIYSTAPPPSSIIAAKSALEIIPSMSSEREKIMNNVELFRSHLNKNIFHFSGRSNITPVVLKEPNKAENIFTNLKKKGIRTALIRPPSFPDGNSALRIAISVNHSQREIYLLAEQLNEAIY